MISSTHLKQVVSECLHLVESSGQLSLASSSHRVRGVCRPSATFVTFVTAGQTARQNRTSDALQTVILSGASLHPGRRTVNRCALVIPNSQGQWCGTSSATETECPACFDLSKSQPAIISYNGSSRPHQLGLETAGKPNNPSRVRQGCVKTIRHRVDAIRPWVVGGRQNTCIGWRYAVAGATSVSDHAGAFPAMVRLAARGPRRSSSLALRSSTRHCLPVTAITRADGCPLCFQGPAHGWPTDHDA